MPVLFFEGDHSIDPERKILNLSPADISRDRPNVWGAVETIREDNLLYSDIFPFTVKVTKRKDHVWKWLWS